VPVSLSDLTARQEGSDAVLRWQSGSGAPAPAFRVDRARAGGSSEPVRAPVEAFADRRFHLRDPAPGPGLLQYRVLAAAPDGDVVLGRADVDMLPSHRRGVFLDSPAPNPSSSGATLRFGLEGAGPARVTVIDARGRLLRALIADVRLNAGAQEIRWDGKDTQGRSVANGVYRVRLEAAGRVVARSVTLVR
jgi:hypothetical protein